MADITAKMPWRVWVKVHGKAICQALPVAFLIVVEGRDMYYRATWQIQDVPPTHFESGDVIALCNRWYTLPTWSHVLYSLLSKVLLKSAWDDVGVISVKTDGKPNIVYCDFNGAHEMPLDEFLQQRVPRGAALRKLVPDAGVARPSPAVSDLFMSEVGKLKVEPWYLFSASMRSGQEFKYYEFCVQMNLQRQKIREMINKGQSRPAIHGQQDKLREMDVMRQYLAKFVTKDETFHLFNGSLVASFLATFGFLDRERPSPSRQASPFQPPAPSVEGHRRSVPQPTLQHMTRQGCGKNSAVDGSLLGSCDSWNVRLPKRCALLTELPKVHQRLTQVSTLYHGLLGGTQPTDEEKDTSRALIVPYTQVIVSPMYISVSVDADLATARLGERTDYTSIPQGITVTEARPLLRQMVVTLLALHSRHIVHGHCTIDSFLARKQNGNNAELDDRRVVLVDHFFPISFLAAQSVQGRFARACAAPEIGRNEPFTFAADVWSVGVLLLQMLLPENKSLVTEDVEDTDLLSPFLGALDGVTRSLLVQCLKSDPSGRPSLWEILEHPFFARDNTQAAAESDAESISGDSETEAETEEDAASEDEESDSEEESDSTA